MQRYAVLAGAPEGERAKLRATVRDLVLDALLRGAALGGIPLLVWVAVGPARRRELLAHLPRWRGLLGTALVLGLVAALWQPWVGDADTGEETGDRPWVPLADFLGPGVPLPAELREVAVQGDVTTAQTRRLIESAISTYDRSKVFYSDAAERAAGLTTQLRQPAEGETVAILVSDRHDNVGMDKVARAVADAAGATAVLDAGDDTSTGSSWEAFSLDSLSAAFDDGYDADHRWAVAGNHDNGTFVPRYLADHGWTVLDGEVSDGPGGSTLLGVPDPRASGLGNWRDETGLSFDEVAERLADAACASSKRIATLLVHDANLGRPALERGCVDLVVGGHLHLQVGPTRIVGGDGAVGWSYTNGTTGGAAYAFAMGSKLRREAEVSLITYADGRPVGIQPVRLQTNGEFRVDPYVALTY
jgi:predicted phosphodiesterase